MADGNGTLAEKGFTGKFLNVNLTTGEISVERPDESLYRRYLGGYGIGARMLWDRVPVGVDPLGPGNMLGMFAGLLTGTPLFGQRWQVVCKSPLTGGWGDANCGGDFGGMMKLAGWDGFMFFGKAEKPVYLVIEDDKFELRDATDQWGQLAIDNEMMLKQRHGKKASVANIGPAARPSAHLRCLQRPWPSGRPLRCRCRHGLQEPEIRRRRHRPQGHRPDARNHQDAPGQPR
ncbi:MAG: aldehyde ferredoxin oxidoreductase N-terminal domain-containing protein [Dehalococcoidia bacterium]